MNKVPLLSCIALTLFLLANGAPTLPPPPTVLQYLLRDLIKVQDKLQNVSERMKKYELHIPSNTSSMADLQCFTKELTPVAGALKYESKAQTIQEYINNINETVNSLTGTETTQCHYATKMKIEGFFKEFVSFSQKLRALTQ
ncbi:interleukin-2 [Vombatus ursinus]|uniref:Interleukin-2 n=1 Tax=Vombatus ursinus TaxID=29139 RepID=A0A4X2L5G9_VOMUR|nr:interleukin-2 [Vombatus ursinus]